MNEIEFKQLCRDTCIELSYESPDELGEQHRIKLDGVTIVFFFDESITPDKIFCYVHLGSINQDHKEVLLERLLTLNILTATKTSGVYGMDSATGEAIFAQQLLFPDLLTPKELAEILRQHAIHAKNFSQIMLDPLLHEPLQQALEYSLTDPALRLS